MTGWCILLVDDDETNRIVVRLLLQRRGFDVLEAAGGSEAIALFGARRIDVVLMDIVMPGMDGAETTRRLRRLGPRGRSVPIIALTANLDRLDRSEFSAIGMNGFLRKPFDITVAMHTIGALLERRAMGRA